MIVPAFCLRGESTTEDTERQTYPGHHPSVLCL